MEIPHGPRTDSPAATRRALLQTLTRHSEWRPDQLLGWLCEDVLADLTGHRKASPPPPGALPAAVRELSERYADAVIAHAPLADVLGEVYMRWPRAVARAASGSTSHPGRSRG